MAEEPEHLLETGAEAADDVREGAVVQRGGERHRYQRPRRRDAGNPRERHHHRAPHGQQPRQENAVHAVAAILLGDALHGPGGEDVAAQEAARDDLAMPARQGVHGGARPHVRRPGEQEDGPRVHDAAAGEKSAQRDGNIGRNGRKDVFDGGERGDQPVQRTGREPLEKRNEVGQGRGPLGSASVTTAITAMPSPRPIHPIPSFVFAFTETCAGPVSSASASFSFMASRYGASLGSSRITVTSVWTNWNPASTTLRNALFNRSIELAPFHCGSSFGNIRPMSPSPAAPRIASVTACAIASASEWPARPLALGISTPPRISLRPAANGCES